jgi:hypothetical protein
MGSGTWPQTKRRFSSWGEVGEKNVSLQEGEGEKMTASLSALPFSLAREKRQSK